MKVDRVVEFKWLAERSRFFAVLFPAAGEDDVLKMVRLKKGEHRKANHHCWAFRGQAGSSERSRDDGEVGHPGRVLLELLRREDLEGGAAGLARLRRRQARRGRRFPGFPRSRRGSDRRVQKTAKRSRFEVRRSKFDVKDNRNIG